ncbi:MAG: low temperature requirement protein A [Burkholderiales bacterium]|nr:low temperature requirement protein A [Burkholderiales bacterium]
MVSTFYEDLFVKSPTTMTSGGEADLVFAFAISQLSHHLLTHDGWRAAAETLVMLVGVFGVWSYTSGGGRGDDDGRCCSNRGANAGGAALGVLRKCIDLQCPLWAASSINWSLTGSSPSGARIPRRKPAIRRCAEAIFSSTQGSAGYGRPGAAKGHQPMSATRCVGVAADSAVRSTSHCSPSSSTPGRRWTTQCGQSPMEIERREAVIAEVAAPQPKKAFAQEHELAVSRPS